MPTVILIAARVSFYYEYKKYYERFIYIFIVSDTRHNFKQRAVFKQKILNLLLVHPPRPGYNILHEAYNSFKFIYIEEATNFPSEHGLLQRHSRRWQETEAVMRGHRGDLNIICAWNRHVFSHRKLFIYIFYVYRNKSVCCNWWSQVYFTKCMNARTADLRIFQETLTCEKNNSVSHSLLTAMFEHMSSIRL